ncbi:hypothetical protein A2159_00560 [Candidatus Woesebacteria bacterium RBG_13_34_9]|uniref:Lipoprotein n=1 Tax=Candidatus Woesebacteria bacterium RBG_13_34_9 TaxID=1802477 RepID=A0A1F7X1Z0_9BACT|nr:MAG: hypothetical protein A2159_00560 [Candidatus Woesebacteria bacterium RBG_13_34_9]
MKEISRKGFLELGFATAAGALLSSCGICSKEEREMGNISEEKLWGTYKVGEAGLGEIQGLDMVCLDNEIKDVILNISKHSDIKDLKLATIEVTGKERNILMPLAWTVKDDKVTNRWSIWSFDNQNEIIPLNKRNKENMVFIDITKLNIQGCLVMGPRKDTGVEKFISYVQNWGWEMYLPYKDLDKKQGPIPLQQTAQALQEFLTK